MSDNDKSLEEVNSTLRYSNEQFDKTIVFITSGAFGISFAFIEKIVKLKEATHKIILIDAWYIFAIVIFISLVCHFLSSQANSWAVKNHKLSDENYNKGISKWNRWIRGLNISMIVGLLLGTLLLIHFINLNI